jgi:hypothetical protein
MPQTAELTPAEIKNREIRKRVEESKRIEKKRAQLTAVKPQPAQVSKDKTGNYLIYRSTSTFAASALNKNFICSINPMGKGYSDDVTIITMSDGSSHRIVAKFDDLIKIL